MIPGDKWLEPGLSKSCKSEGGKETRRRKTDRKGNVGVTERAADGTVGIKIHFESSPLSSEFQFSRLDPHFLPKHPQKPHSVPTPAPTEAPPSLPAPPSVPTPAPQPAAGRINDVDSPYPFATLCRVDRAVALPPYSFRAFYFFPCPSRKGKKFPSFRLSLI